METLATSPFTVIPAVFGGYLSVDKIRRFLPEPRRNDHIKERVTLLLMKRPFSLDSDQT
jgi:hypothetical protein